MSIGSISSGALNVAGSIGDVSSAVQSLLGPSAGSWEASLGTASFGNVPFAVDGARTRAGRRNVVHTYAYRDDVWVEDQGKLPRQFQIRGFLIENSRIYGGGGVIAQRDALLAACEKAGVNTLVHPTFGTIKSVNCLDIEIEERKDLGRVFEFTLSLIVSGVQQYPTSTQSTSDVVASAASAVQVSALSNFESTVKADLALGADAVSRAVNTAISYYQQAVTLVNGVMRVYNAVSSLSGNFGRLFGGGNSGYTGSNTSAPASTTADDLLADGVANTAAVATAGVALSSAAAGLETDTDTYGAAAVAFVQSLVDTATSPKDGIQMLSTLAAFTNDINTTSSIIGTAIGEVNDASCAYFRRVALSALAQQVSEYQPSSRDDAVSVQESVVTLIDAEILVAGDAGDDDSYLSLRAMRQAVVADLQARGADLASIATFSFASSLPALTLANRIYRDPSRSDSLVMQVNPIHPAFMPTTFDALAS